MTGFWSFLSGAAGNVGVWVVKKATPRIFDSLVTVVKNWHQECLKTENKFDDVLSGVVLKVAEALASTDEAQADPDAKDDDGGTGSGEEDPDPSTAAAPAGG